MGYDRLPGGELTLEYILAHPDKVSEMLEIWGRKGNSADETELLEIYEGIGK